MVNGGGDDDYGHGCDDVDNDDGGDENTGKIKRWSDLAIAQAHIIWEYGVSSEKGETTWRKLKLSYLWTERTKQPSIRSSPPGGIDVAMTDQEAAVDEVVSS